MADGLVKTMTKGQDLINNFVKEVEEKRAEEKRAEEDKKILRLAKKLFGEDMTFTPSFSASPLEYDIRGEAKTVNAANFSAEMAAIRAAKETLRRVLMALENGEDLLEDL